MIALDRQMDAYKFSRTLNVHSVNEILTRTLNLRKRLHLITLFIVINETSAQGSSSCGQLKLWLAYKYVQDTMVKLWKYPMEHLQDEISLQKMTAEFLSQQND